MMSNAVKNIVLIFTLLSAVFLVFFCVELFMINRDEDNGPSGSISIGGPANSDEPVNGDDLPEDTDPSQNGENGTNPTSGQTEEPGQTVRPPVQHEGIRANHLITGGAELVLHYDDELFEFVNHELDGYIYEYLGEGEVALEIGHALIQPQDGIEGLAAKYLRNYSDEIESVLEGERRIGQSSIRGIYVHSEHDGTYYEAWLTDIAEYGEERMALVFAIYYEEEEERAALYKILDSMEIALLEEQEAVDDNEVL